MNRATFTIVIEYDGKLDSLDLYDYLESSIDQFIGEFYSEVKYQNHTIEIEEQDADKD